VDKNFDFEAKFNFLSCEKTEIIKAIGHGPVIIATPSLGNVHAV
jgi:hypothetical protein